MAMKIHFIPNQGTMDTSIAYCGVPVEKAYSSTIPAAVNCRSCQNKYVKKHCPKCQSLGWSHIKKECATCGHSRLSTSKPAYQQKTNPVFMVFDEVNCGSLVGMYKSYSGAVKAITEAIELAGAKQVPGQQRRFNYKIEEQEVKE